MILFGHWILLMNHGYAAPTCNGGCGVHFTLLLFLKNFLSQVAPKMVQWWYGVRMSTTTVSPDSLTEQNIQLRKLNRILRRQVELLSRQNKVYESLHAMDSEAVQQLNGRSRKRRPRELN
jgi:hypothetical protein